ncbi:arsenical pump-driving ATPase [Gordonia rhizosphera]|uniref:Arsenite-transporting ATPase n=1 Tax=Gordonia rhizosphera NBRC 16068 TaxID=1108045 RepID=K6WJ93_9ACTN|nr:arsenical pump-driving ATPase [Gordonia rhizosphera]GAB93826.1 arsenite-transporting ATPase [Gordonia rhizosphera NBRC 16068]
MSAPQFLSDLPRFVFFTGKGGVGKTSIACASALRLARAGKRVLLVSTDPASNVGQVFGVTIGNTITEIGSVPGLSALEIDPEQAADDYRERIIGPVRGLLPESALASITEQLSGSCTTEVASFDEFTGLLTDNDGAIAGFDHILFDTAPTGHTIRLLQLPGNWTEFLETGKGDASCLGPLAGLDKQKATYAAAVAALADPERTRLVLVARPGPSSLREIERTHTELAALGMTRPFVVVNAVMPAPSGSDDALSGAVRRREQTALADMPAALSALPQDRIELKPANMVGVDALSTLFDADAVPEFVDADPAAVPDVADAPLRALVDEIERDGHGLVMCMGKGGVGKTTVAAAVAVALAERGHDVHLTTTDPAAHLAETLQGGVEHLHVSRIDPAEASRTYRDRVMATKGAHLDEEGRATLAEDLRSPCTEEVAVFQAFSRVIHESRSKFVVVDTAPTGHTLLLMDATGSYHREIARQMGDGAHFTTPLMRLQDPRQTKVLLVTLAETTPVLEAAELQGDLERAGIRPWAWVINNSVAAAAPATPLLRRRAAAEIDQIDRVRGRHASRYAVIPLLADEPVGIPALEVLTTAQLRRNPLVPAQEPGTLRDIRADRLPHGNMSTLLDEVREERV